MRKFLALSILAINLLVTPFVSAAPLTSSQKQELEQINKILTENPDIIEALHASLQSYLASQVTMEDTLVASHDYLYNNPVHPTLGSDKPELTIINFTDYNCYYCKKLEGGMVEVLKDYPQIKVVNVLLPFQQRIITGMNISSAEFAMDVWQNHRDKFAEVHKLMLAKPGKLDKAAMIKITERTGTQSSLTPNPKYKGVVQQNSQIFSNLGLRGTPSLIIGEQIIPGYMPKDQLEAAIKRALNAQS
ncbi:DsbA family protein [Vibrio sp. SS-MA-C1-2]|uniref:DsbA family protein n=1 Tax=Vibrio sp. SS-MA-C1-2 TaxID=2908646 RepID=UPI001F2A6E6C|nr:DsbA family protein [Vibrio sp. SS-MA-C1-2]UJF18236.1 DsbA family protein [Vibrio sp. SS-MA-C1-2]